MTDFWKSYLWQRGLNWLVALDRWLLKTGDHCDRFDCDLANRTVHSAGKKTTTNNNKNKVKNKDFLPNWQIASKNWKCAHLDKTRWKLREENSFGLFSPFFSNVIQWFSGSAVLNQFEHKLLYAIHNLLGRVAALNATLIFLTHSLPVWFNSERFKYWVTHWSYIFSAQWAIWWYKVIFNFHHWVLLETSPLISGWAMSHFPSTVSMGGPRYMRRVVRMINFSTKRAPINHKGRYSSVTNPMKSPSNGV